MFGSGHVFQIKMSLRENASQHKSICSQNKRTHTYIFNIKTNGLEWVRAYGQLEKLMLRAINVCVFFSSLSWHADWNITFAINTYIYNVLNSTTGCLRIYAHIYWIFFYISRSACFFFYWCKLNLFVKIIDNYCSQCREWLQCGNVARKI